MDGDAAAVPAAMDGDAAAATADDVPAAGGAVHVAVLSSAELPVSAAAGEFGAADWRRE